MVYTFRVMPEFWKPYIDDNKPVFEVIRAYDENGKDFPEHQKRLPWKDCQNLTKLQAEIKWAELSKKHDESKTD